MSDVEELEEIEKTLDAVEGSMAKIDAGTYGTCESCGDALGDEVLAEDPTAPLCETCLQTRLDG